jgi:hypothetical protein
MGKHCRSSTIDCGRTSISRVRRELRTLNPMQIPEREIQEIPSMKEEEGRTRRKRKEKPKAIKEMLVQKKIRTQHSSRMTTPAKTQEPVGELGTKEMMEERLPAETQEPVGELGTEELGHPT